MQEALRAWLVGTAGVAALVGGRVAWGARPRGTILPAISLHMIDGEPDYTLAGESGLARARVQIDCWGDSYADVTATARAVTAAISGQQKMINGVRFQGAFVDAVRDLVEDGPPPDELLHRVSIDVILWYSAEG